MNLSPRISAAACILLSSLLLAAGFAYSAQWFGVVLAGLILLVWLRSFRKDGDWLAVAALVSAAGLASAGLISGAPSYLMLPGVTLALASWDLILFEHSLAGDERGPTTSRLVRKHYASLALVLGVGLLALAADQLIRLQIPFLVMVVLAAGLTVFLERAWRSIQK